MRWWKCILVGSATLILSTANSSAEEFTAADVLAWKKETQDWYFETSIAMAASIATRNPTGHAECINDWYYAPTSGREEAHRFIRETLAKFSGHSPETVLIAVIEKACGSLNFQE